jgi:hypothetical protein
VIGVGYPHTVTDSSAYFDDETSTDVGSASAVVIGALIAGVGQLLLFIGAVGRGVHLGVQAAGRP